MSRNTSRGLLCQVRVALLIPMLALVALAGTLPSSRCRVRMTNSSHQAEPALRQPGTTGADEPLQGTRRADAAATTPRHIAIVLDAYFERMYAGIAAYSRTANWDLATSMIRNPGVLPRHQNWTGVIALAMFDRSVEWLKKLNVPVVYTLHPDHVPCDSPFVTYDFEAAGRCGARHLLELGNVNFGFYRVSPESEAVSIHHGFNQEIERHGFSARDWHFPPSRLQSSEQARTSRAERVEWLIGKLKKADFPLALMAEDDRFAMDVVFAARTLGLRIPDDLAILGAEDDRMILASVAVELSSVDANLYGVGWRSAELLDRMINGAAAGSEHVPLLTCVPPQGCGRAAIDDAICLQE